jgi:hypothetical protein
MLTAPALAASECYSAVALKREPLKEVMSLPVTAWTIGAEAFIGEGMMT